MYNSEFSKELYERRKELKLTQQEAAKTLDVELSVYKKYEEGSLIPNPKRSEKIRAFLGKSSTSSSNSHDTENSNSKIDYDEYIYNIEVSEEENRDVQNLISFAEKTLETGRKNEIRNVLKQVELKIIDLEGQRVGAEVESIGTDSDDKEVESTDINSEDKAVESTDANPKKIQGYSIFVSYSEEYETLLKEIKNLREKIQKNLEFSEK